MGKSQPLDLVSPSLLQSDASVGANVLNSYVGKGLEDFCPWYHDEDENHCAHFVSHVLKLRLPHAALCTNVGDDMVYADRKKGYCVRVDQVFNSCANRKHWDDSMVDDPSCFVIATIKSVISSQDPLTLRSDKTKHIGILLGGNVYNYSNTHGKVMSKTIAEFHRHYGKHTILLRADLRS